MMANTVSIATENFIKAIYNSEQEETLDTKPGSIARTLGISNAAATDMARKLATKKLINYEKYRELKLTASGKKVALIVIRKHRLWETFLHQVFGLSLHEIHREAELLEHLTSDFLSERISLFLGNPTVDPHGDPIPDSQGYISEDNDSILLSSGDPGKEYEITRLSGSDKEFFDFCHASNLTVGSILFIKKQYVKNKMTEIEINGARILLNAEIAGILYVKRNNRIQKSKKQKQ
jgi:DtxR family transcriptional regulator, Mn-dependent transcriptional regulator